MEEAMNQPPLTFDLLRNIELRRMRLQGPVSDYRLLAGLLFRHQNDPIHRSVKFFTRSFSIIRLESISERICSFLELEVQNCCVELLHAEDCLEGRLSNLDQLYLSAVGARRVVTEWLNTSIQVLDKFAAMPTSVSTRSV
jgi:hypothetical protein